MQCFSNRKAPILVERDTEKKTALPITIMPCQTCTGSPNRDIDTSHGVAGFSSAKRRSCIPSPASSLHNLHILEADAAHVLSHASYCTVHRSTSLTRACCLAMTCTCLAHAFGRTHACEIVALSRKIFSATECLASAKAVRKAACPSTLPLTRS